MSEYQSLQESCSRCFREFSELRSGLSADSDSELDNVSMVEGLKLCEQLEMFKRKLHIIENPLLRWVPRRELPASRWTPAELLPVCCVQIRSGLQREQPAAERSEPRAPSGGSEGGSRGGGVLQLRPAPVAPERPPDAAVLLRGAPDPGEKLRFQSRSSEEPGPSGPAVF